MTRAPLPSVFGTVLLIMMAAPAGAQSTILEQEAHAIGLDAYNYLYPLVSMDVTRRQFTNVEPGKRIGKGPMNTFNSYPAYPAADDRTVVRFNFDTLYSPAGSSRQSPVLQTTGR